MEFVSTIKKRGLSPIFLLILLSISGFGFKKYHHLTITTTSPSRIENAYVKYTSPDNSFTFGNLSEFYTASHGHFSNEFPKSVEVGWTNSNGENITIVKQFPTDLKRFIHENGDDLYIIIGNNSDWNFAYKKKQGHYTFLELIGENTEYRAKRYLSKELIEAAYNGKISLIKKMVLQSDIDINHHLIGSQITALGAAFNSRKERIRLRAIDFLLASGAKPGIEIMWAARSKDLQVLDLFLNHGADLNYYRHDSGQYSPLIVAIDRGHLNIVKWLIENGADVNRAIYNDITPIYSAALNNEYEITKLLLSHNANPNIPIEGTNTYPVDAAKRHPDKRIYNLLLAAK